MTDRPSRPSLRAPSRAGSAAAPAPARRGASSFIRGEAGMRRTDEEIERQKQKAEERRAASSKPFRFFVPTGETRQVIVCDDQPDFFLYEHGLKDSEGRWGRLFTGCIKEHENCPVCRATGKESYYAMVLTVIDLTPYETREGDVVEFSRKLLIVKPAQQKKFLRFYNKEGTLRGALFDMTRDGDKDSSIGNDIEFVEFVPEDEMTTYTRSWKDREGKRHTDACYEPYVYEDIFEEPTAENLAAIVGADPIPGSRASNDRELGRGRAGRDSTPSPRGRRDAAVDDWDDAGDSRTYGAERAPARRGSAAPSAEDERPARPARTAGRRAAPPDDDAQDEAPPPRRSRAALAAPAAPARRTRPAPRDTDANEDDAPTPPARRGRAAPQADDTDTDDAPPPRRAGRPAAARKDDLDDDIPF